MMDTLELLEILTDRARRFRADRDYFWRNEHMHAIKETPPQEMVDAVLTGFINDVAMKAGVDYALYASDLAKPPIEKHQ